MPRALLLALALFLPSPWALAEAPPELIRSARTGLWSAASTWEGGKVPTAGAKVQIRAGHTVTYDLASDQVIRSIHIAGTLTFARDKDTRLDVGLIKIQAGDDASEDGFNCEMHMKEPDRTAPRPALEVGTANDPIPAGHTARIRLAAVEGLNTETCPAIICCGGRLDLHGAPMSRTWVKLGANAEAGDKHVRLAEQVTGWRVGDRIIVTGTSRVPIINDREDSPPVSLRGSDQIQTEERIITAIDGNKLTLDKPLTHKHRGSGDYRGEVANLSRNVVVESANPSGVRGHTMYHRYSAGAISYTELRHLGKQGLLGKYSIHYHLCGDTMRGSYVLGASIWDSHNRWLTIHGTDYLVVRDCVGYQSIGHGFFQEDGTEVGNVLDRNLAVLAFNGKPLPQQVLPYDTNDGAGFWWANSRNSFTRNVACECDTYGFFFQAPKTAVFDPVLPVRQPDGTTKKVDIRKLSFIRFEDNESHTQQFHGFSLGGGNRVDLKARGTHLGDVGGVGPDERHPFVIRNLKVWDCLWPIHLRSPSVLVDNINLHDARYGFFMSNYTGHAYRDVKHSEVLSAKAGKLFLPIGKNAGGNNQLPNVEADFPKPLDPIDDLPPLTVITHIRPEKGKLVMRGTCADNGTIVRVSVNGQEARPLASNFAEWEITLDPPTNGRLIACAVDKIGNAERQPHVVTLGGDGPRTIVARP